MKVNRMDKRPIDMIIGSKWESRNYGKFSIVSYVDCSNVCIQFEVTGFELTTSATSIRGGQVKDCMLPSIFNVGYVGTGPYHPTELGNRTQAYECWFGMLKRCYDVNRTTRNKSYDGVVVCDEWCNFQNFAEWFNAHHVTGMHIDKDIKQRGVKNKVYSPSTCIFITPTKNNIEAHALNYKFKNPEGEIINVYNLAKFAKDNNLTRRSMGKVHNGERNHHKGWTKA